MDIITESYSLPHDYAQRIRQLRQRLGLSQQQFADLIDVSVPLLQQWERGQIQPAARYWQQIVLAETQGMQAFHPSFVGARLVRESSTMYTVEAETPSFLDFSADPEIVRTVVEGERDARGIDGTPMPSWVLWPSSPGSPNGRRTVSAFLLPGLLRS